MNIAVNKNKDENTVSAIIVAAGTSSRMHGIDKQLLDIGGMPVIARAVFAFQKSDLVSEIIIVTRKEIIDEIKNLTIKYNLNKVKSIVVGGSTRQESVFNGIRECSCDYIAIHDGARPFVSQKVIKETIEEAFEKGCVAAAVTAKDTVKIADSDNLITKTVNRDTVRLMQTPQVFNLKLYMNAMNTVENSKDFTDDCMLMEKAGYKVYTVESSSLNIKITTRDDIILGNAIVGGDEDV